MLWVLNHFDFSFKPSKGRSGEILVIWDKNIFSIKRKHVLEYALCLEGVWGIENKLLLLLFMRHVTEEENQLFG